MEFNKALENYRKIEEDLNSKIREREGKIEQLKSDIKNIKEGRKQEIKKGIFTNTIKKFAKTNDITDKAAEIEILMCEVEALNEMKNGESKELMKAAKDLMKAVDIEIKRIEKDRQDREEEAQRLYEKSKEIKDQLNSTNEFANVTGEVCNTMNHLIKVKYPKEYERYTMRGLSLLSLVQRVVEEQ